MKQLINWLKKIFRKPDLKKCDYILSALDLNRWYGMVGKTIYYPDAYTKMPIFTIDLTKGIVFILDDSKKDYFNNIGLLNLNKKEKIYLYQKIESFMVSALNEQTKVARTALLAHLGITDENFTFLVTTSEYKKI